MSIFFKARGSTSVGLLLIRLVLGSLFLISGAQKVYHLPEFIKSIQAMGQMNDNLAFILAFILPFFELIFGALYIIGLFTPITSFVLSCVIISFFFVLGVGDKELPFSYNFVFLACTLATMFSGAGIFSFDVFMDKKKDGRKITVREKNIQVKKEGEAKAIYVDDKDMKIDSSDDDVRG